MVLPLAVLIALLTTGVMSRGMLGEAARWVAWAQFGGWTDAGSFLHPTTTTDNVVIGANTEAGSDIRLNDGGAMIVNEQGNDSDCRIEGDTNANLIYTDASTDRVGIGTSGPRATLDIQRSGGGGVVTTDAELVVEDSGTGGGGCAINVLSNATGSARVVFGNPDDLTVGVWTADSSTGDCSFQTDTLLLDCGQKVKRRAVSGTYTVLATDYYLGITASSAVTLNLPAAATAGVGREYLLVIESGTSTVTVDPNGAETVNGAGTVNIGGTAFTIHTLVCNGTGWFVN